MPSPEQIRDRFASYVSALESRDLAGLLACFADGAVQVDPYPSQPNVGKDAIGAFFERTFGMAESMAATAGRAVTAGDRGVFPFTLVTTLPGGAGKLEIDIIDLITVDDAGLITEITAYVDFAGARQVD